MMQKSAGKLDLFFEIKLSLEAPKQQTEKKLKKDYLQLFFF
jgi:hypothetical protein